jgi:hypothetical protein
MADNPTQQEERIDSTRQAEPLDPDHNINSSDEENITLIDEQTEEAEIEFEIIREQEEFLRREDKGTLEEQKAFLTPQEEETVSTASEAR